MSQDRLHTLIMIGKTVMTEISSMMMDVVAYAIKILAGLVLVVQQLPLIRALRFVETDMTMELTLVMMVTLLTEMDVQILVKLKVDGPANMDQFLFLISVQILVQLK